MKPDEPLIGVINAGSSSLKFSFYEGEKRLLAGQIEGLGARPAASATGSEGGTIAPPDLGARHDAERDIARGNAVGATAARWAAARASRTSRGTWRRTGA